MAFWDWSMAINLKSYFFAAQAAIAQMKPRGQGAIINFSSVAYMAGMAGFPAYTSSNAAIVSLTQSLAREFGRDGIRVNAVCPGLIKTKFSQALWEDEKTLDRFTKYLPIARMGTVEEIARLTLFLASPASGYCTGGIYTADGGTTI